MDCFFFSCYQKGMYPICNIGPSRCFMVANILFSTAVAATLVGNIMSYDKDNYINAYICYGLLICNYLLFLNTICGDPGIKQEVYQHYINILSDEDVGDLEDQQ